MLNRFTDGAAGAAVVSPLWLQTVQGWLQGVSDLASVMLPVAGLAWFVYQFIMDRKDRARLDVTNARAEGKLDRNL